MQSSKVMEFSFGHFVLSFGHFVLSFPGLLEEQYFTVFFSQISHYVGNVSESFERTSCNVLLT
jgi:hypothetical protein